MSPDQMRYLVVSAHSDGEYLPERAIADLDRASTIRDIRAGQFGDVAHVIEFNIAECIICDRTEDILRECEISDAPLTGQDVLDAKRDHERALRNEQATAEDHDR